MWGLIKFLLFLVLAIAVVALLRSKLKGATWAAAWNDNFGGLVRIGPAVKP
jgi:hypothetical protein